MVRRHERVPGNLVAAINGCGTGKLPWPLFIYGGIGTGKTCGVLYLCDRTYGKSVYTTYSDLVERLRLAKTDGLWVKGTHDESRIFEIDIWDEWRNAALCVLDEIGTRDKVSDHMYEALLKAIDSRHGKPLVLISNMSLKQIDGVFDQRISSRCASGTVVKVEGPDRRLERK